MFRTLILSCLLSICMQMSSVAGAHGEILVIPGTGDSQLLLRGLVDLYSHEHSDLVIIPESIGSSGGIRQLLKGKAKLARVARKLNEQESAAGLSWRQFAYAPIVFASHAEQTAVTNISSSQVEAVFKGKIKDWQELGGAPGTIYIAQRELGDSSRTVLAKHFPFFAEGQTLLGEVLYSTPDMVNILTRYRQTLGYLPLSASKNRSIQVLSLDGVEPIETNLRKGRYPLWVPLALVWKEKPDRAVGDFLNFISSPAARKLMRQFGVVPVEEP